MVTNGTVRGKGAAGRGPCVRKEDRYGIGTRCLAPAFGWAQDPPPPTPAPRPAPAAPRPRALAALPRPRASRSEYFFSEVSTFWAPRQKYVSGKHVLLDISAGNQLDKIIRSEHWYSLPADTALTVLTSGGHGIPNAFPDRRPWRCRLPLSRHVRSPARL